ncbi:MAG: transglutaminase domain-containing protein, partial [Patescibacteria group bacterium]|nr:transglutaminase domain-containing protein [Patescibacteria group bacterium]
YLEQQQYWQVNNQQIKNLAKQLKTPEAIYEYVVQHVTYDFSRITNGQVRLGALAVLQNPSSAVCLEFTDLFVTLSRAAGIPAREVDGFANTQNTISRPLSLSQDILHAWPEYYDDTEHSWIMVDPTWGNTTGGVDYFHTLDFDHVAFVVKGVSSTYPIPAGGYKFDNQVNEKDVAVTVSQQRITALPTVSMAISMPPLFMSGLPLSGAIALQNTGSVIFPAQPMSITTRFLNPRQQFLTNPPIPPFGRISRTLAFQKTSFLTNTHDTITMTLAGKTIQTKIAIVPFTNQYLLIGGIFLVIFIGVLWLITRKTRRV